jgi:16S rRNA (cytosine967-C5)-methyltransferase
MRSTLDRHSGLDERDRALLTELVYGVLRWQGRLDWQIDRLSRIKPEKIDPAVRLLLRLGLYQIFFLDRVPAHAAVNETVKSFGSNPPHVVRFVSRLPRRLPKAQRKLGLALCPRRSGRPPRVVLPSPWFVRSAWTAGVHETRRCDADSTVAPCTG